MSFNPSATVARVLARLDAEAEREAVVAPRVLRRARHAQLSELDRLRRAAAARVRRALPLREPDGGAHRAVEPLHAGRLRLSRRPVERQGGANRGRIRAVRERRVAVREERCRAAASARRAPPGAARASAVPARRRARRRGRAPRARSRRSPRAPRVREAAGGGDRGRIGGDEARNPQRLERRRSLRRRAERPRAPARARASGRQGADSPTVATNEAGSGAERATTSSSPENGSVARAADCAPSRSTATSSPDADFRSADSTAADCTIRVVGGTVPHPASAPRTNAGA